MKNCSHNITIEKNGRFFRLKCNKCSLRVVCRHSPTDKFLVCEKCIDSVKKELDIKS